MKFKELMDICKKGAIKHSPEILVGVGLAGMLATVIFSSKATVKVSKKVEDHKKMFHKEKVEPKYLWNMSWKEYILPTSTFVLSSVCIIGSNRISAKRYAALSAAYTLSEAAFKTYKNKVIETIGEKKEKAIMDSIAEDQVKNNPPKGDVVIVGGGQSLIRDSLSGRYFYSTIEKIKNAEIDLNYKQINQDFVSCNEYYDILGLEATTDGETLGWNVSSGKIKFVYSYVAGPNDEPCLNIGFDYQPNPRYRELY